MKNQTKTKILPIGLIIPRRCHARFIDKMKSVLEKQGQIEPLQVQFDPISKTYGTFRQDAWGCETVHAARALGWPSLLVCITQRYIY